LLLVGLGVSATIAGCATPTRIGGDEAAFERTGRFAVTVSEAGAPTEAVQGGFAWRDAGGRLRIDLVNPLGSTLAQITVQSSAAMLEKADGTIERAPDADTLMAQVVGVALPVADLRDWLHGRPGPGPVYAVQRDAEGRLESFMQNGWQLRLSRYDAQGPGLVRLDRRDGARQISVRLAMNAQ